MFIVKYWRADIPKSHADCKEKSYLYEGHARRYIRVKLKNGNAYEFYNCEPVTVNGVSVIRRKLIERGKPDRSGYSLGSVLKKNKPL